MRLAYLTFFYVILTVTACQLQELSPAPATPILTIPTPPSPFPSPPTPKGSASPEFTPTSIMCEMLPREINLSSLPKIPEFNAPPPGAGASMVYDQNRQVSVLFGGSYDSDTWEYDGLEWKQVKTVNHPPDSFIEAMAFDSNRGVVVMYGDFYDKSNWHNVWEYDGVNWREILLDHTPEFLRFPVLAYFPLSEKVILFGEYQDSATRQTWAYDGSTWQNLNQDLPATPDPVMQAQAVYDSCHQVLILQTTWDWTYEFDGSAWRIKIQHSHSGLGMPSVLWNSNIVYDTYRRVIVNYGVNWESSEDPWRSETWEFDGVKWQQVYPLQSPPPRSRHAMVFDEARGVTVLFGGRTQEGVLLNDLWEYDGVTWVER
jgi:hypothetical protein